MRRLLISSSVILWALGPLCEEAKAQTGRLVLDAARKAMGLVAKKSAAAPLQIAPKAASTVSTTEGAAAAASGSGGAQGPLITKKDVAVGAGTLAADKIVDRALPNAGEHERDKKIDELLKRSSPTQPEKRKGAKAVAPRSQ